MEPNVPPTNKSGRRDLRFLALAVFVLVVVSVLLLRAF